LILVSFFSCVVDYGNETSKIYQKLCAECHHINRIGLSGPPLLPIFLKKKTDQRLKEIIKNGLPATRMPAFKELDGPQLDGLVTLMKTKAEVKWDPKDIVGSRALEKDSGNGYQVSDLHNLTAMVERGKQRVWILEGNKVLDQFEFANVHGGIKFTPDGRYFFVPSRDGWVGRYDIGKQFFGKIRSSIFLRNIAMARDGKRLVVSTWLPPSLVVLDTETLNLVKTIPVKGKISGVYGLYTRDEVVLTYRDRPLVGFFNPNTLELKHHPITEPVEDFFLDPMEKFLVGSSRRGTFIRAWRLEDLEVVFENKVEGMPHLSSAAFWYDKGSFFFATSHIKAPVVSIWRMYDWKHEKSLKISGNGFFVRTHNGTPHLWIDTGTDQLLLVNKKTLKETVLTPMPGKKILHTEFSADGSLAYVSVYEKDGALLIYDTGFMKLLDKIPVSIPVGKYNFDNKQRRYVASQMGHSVFMGRCWGCHHPDEQAFGPSFQWILKNRNRALIRAQVLDPNNTHQALGYKRNAMPKIPISTVELDALDRYFDVLEGK